MVDTALDNLELDPPLPSPSTTSSLAMSQLQASQTQPAQEALRPADILPSIAFTVLWLFGLARNLASYIVSLGIIPFKTASRLFGLGKQQQEQPTPRPRQDRERRNGHGSRYTSVHLEHVSPAEATNQPTGSTKSNSVSHSSWLLQQHRPASGSATSSSSTVTTLRTSSVPSTPRHTPRSSYSLIPPIEVSTDSEQTKGRSKYRESLLSRRPNRQEEATDDEDSKARARSRIDHSTRRILFVDSKSARRQTAPYPLGSSQDSSFVPSSAPPNVLSDSPAQATVALPTADEAEIDKKSQGKSSPPHSRPVSTNEFGEFVSAPAELDKGHASGAESISDKKGKTKERRRSAFKIFGRKRSNSVTSMSAPAPAATTAEPAVPLTSASTGRLRRNRSPYPAKPGPCPNNSNNTRSVGVMTVSMSDAEVSSSAPASNSISWLRSRPKRLTKRTTRSNSVCSISRTDSLSIHTPPPMSVAPPSILRGSLDDVPMMMTLDPPSRVGLTLNTMTATSPLPPILASPVSSNPSPTLARASTSTSIPGSKPHPGSTTPSKPRFNPLRDLEAHLYNRHGFGTGPSTSDGFRATPVPSGGIPRTKPYELLGIERPTPSSKDAKRRERMSTLDKEFVLDRDEAMSANAVRRTSAPAGSLSVSKIENMRGRPTTPLRSQTLQL